MKETTTNSRDDFLELHVLGGRQGESCVLRLPGGKWGVVDCYTSTPSRPEANPTVALLRHEGVTSLEFVCLTHPHGDHFLGMDQLLNEFPPRMFWYPPFFGEKVRLAQLLKTLHINAIRSNHDSRRCVANELMALVQTYRTNKSIVRKPAVIGTQLYPLPLGSLEDVSIFSVAPSGRRMEAYQSELDRCLDDDRIPQKFLKYSAHNIISIALQICFGQTRIMLGGDVECHGWKDSLAEFGENRVSSHLVKASHHGSSTGFCDGLWRAFSHGGHLPLAVVTPYFAQRLPSQAGLAHIYSHSRRVFTTHKSAALRQSANVPFSMLVPPKSRIKLHEKFGIQEEFRDTGFGHCTFVFDDKGQCNDIRLLGNAGEIVLNP